MFLSRGGLSDCIRDMKQQNKAAPCLCTSVRIWCRIRFLGPGSLYQKPTRVHDRSRTLSLNGIWCSPAPSSLVHIAKRVDSLAPDTNQYNGAADPPPTLLQKRMSSPGRGRRQRRQPKNNDTGAKPQTGRTRETTGANGRPRETTGANGGQRETRETRNQQ